jgi:Collagen triple helix repeat (20 copies)
MRSILVAMSAVLLLIVVGTSGAANNDQGRRLAGPFCIGKANLKNLNGTLAGLVRAGKTTRRAGILRAGAVRSVAKNQPCRPWEVRRNGLALPKIPGPAGPAGKAGANGVNGAPGANGANGAAGVAGAVGATGSVGATGATGATGAVGPKGDKGDRGEKGEKGDKGDRGEPGSGLGDHTRWICVNTEGDTGKPLFDGGTGVTPDCKPGAKSAFKVVTQGDVVVFD